MISKENKKPLNGLVLAGGRSLRMGKDKGSLSWHGQQQRYFLYGLLEGFCDEVFISCRQEQAYSIDKNYNVIKDEYEDGGPLGAIVSAFHQNKNTAWLVVACDLPLLDAATIDFLIEHRDTSCNATGFQSPYDGLPEPLITIWEPNALILLEAALAEGKHCPRKVLLHTSIKLLRAPDPVALSNANTPEDEKKIVQLLKAKLYAGE